MRAQNIESPRIRQRKGDRVTAAAPAPYRLSCHGCTARYLEPSRWHRSSQPRQLSPMGYPCSRRHQPTPRRTGDGRRALPVRDAGSICFMPMDVPNRATQRTYATRAYCVKSNQSHPSGYHARLDRRCLTCRLQARCRGYCTRIKSMCLIPLWPSHRLQLFRYHLLCISPLTPSPHAFI